jgi:glutamate formiminotransferase
MALIECVPNFSEGRDKAKVDSILAAMKHEGVQLLDFEMDADHNRSVVTLVGERDPLIAAVLAGIGKATEVIDLNVQRGAHPRLGATDVVPFIPIEGATLEDCVQMARELGQKVWEQHRIPVYFYEAAAVSPERTNLENIRRGQFEVIREEMGKVESRRPDVGEPVCHPTAGAVVIGARKFLVAYNVYLQTKDVEIAKKVAKAVRYSSGGLRAVKGMGVEVRGQAQVSMNLTDTDLTPIARVFEYVKREAARYGVGVQSSEIVGLIPKRALEDAAEWFLQVENFNTSMILENRLAAVTGGKSAIGGLRAGVQPFLEQLAAPTAAPGGGSASAAAGAMAAGLATMVAAMSRGKKAYAAYEHELTVALKELSTLRQCLESAIDEDSASYEAVVAAYKLAKKPESTPEQGAEAIATALRGATSVPLTVAQCAAHVGEVAAGLRSKTNPRMASDLTVALLLSRAALEGALANVEINLDSFEGGAEAEFIDQTRAKVAELRGAKF